jgi:hypothetical protein
MFVLRSAHQRLTNTCIVAALRVIGSCREPVLQNVATCIYLSFDACRRACDAAATLAGHPRCEMRWRVPIGMAPLTRHHRLQHNTPCARSVRTVTVWFQSGAIYQAFAG